MKINETCIWWHLSSFFHVIDLQVAAQHLALWPRSWEDHPDRSWSSADRFPKDILRHERETRQPKVNSKTSSDEIRSDTINIHKQKSINIWSQHEGKNKWISLKSIRLETLLGAQWRHLFSGDDTTPNEHESYDHPMNCLGFWVLGQVQYGKKSKIIHIKGLMHNTSWKA